MTSINNSSSHIYKIVISLFWMMLFVLDDVITIMNGGVVYDRRAEKDD